MQVLENVQKSKKLVSMFEILFLRNINLFTYNYIHICVIYSFTEMRECFESVNGSTFAEPRILLSSMDKEISFHDDVMLDDTQYEDKLDQLENTWKEIHSV